MGTVFKKTFTKPLPAGATIIVRKGRRLAEWRDAKGKRRTAPVTTGKRGDDRIVVTAGTYTAKYRDGSGIVREVATGCRDESAARSVLTELEKRAERVRGGILTAAEDAVIDHQATPLDGHIDAFIDHQRAKGSSRRADDERRQLRRVAADCGFRRLADLSASAFERWLLDHGDSGMSAATRNEYRIAWVMFGNWCVRVRRLLVNPFADVPRADAKADRRRQRRALTEDELVRLLDAARRRPLVDAMTIRRGKRKGEVAARLPERVRRDLERLGWERALIYKTLVLTGLRRGELASVTVGQLDLDGAFPCLVLDAADEKNREGSTIPLRSDLAADLREWLAAKTVAMGLPTGLPADAPLFAVPKDLVRVLDKDLAAAGIPKRDDRGRTVDVHALRHTFGTHLSKGGVHPRAAQAAMRHSTIDLTMNVYTDPRLLDVAGAVEALPALPLGGESRLPAATLKATGTDDLGCLPIASKIAPMLAPKAGKTGISVAIPGKIGGREDVEPNGSGAARNPLVESAYEAEGTGFEPATPFGAPHFQCGR